MKRFSPQNFRNLHNNFHDPEESDNSLHDKSDFQLEQEISKLTIIKKFFFKTVITVLTVLSMQINALKSLFCIKSLTVNDYINVI